MTTRGSHCPLRNLFLIFIIDKSNLMSAKFLYPEPPSILHSVVNFCIFCNLHFKHHQALKGPQKKEVKTSKLTSEEGSLHPNLLFSKFFSNINLATSKLHYPLKKSISKSPNLHITILIILN